MIREIGPCLVCEFRKNGDRITDSDLGRHLESSK
jgi:hypothetical protein